jgi:hypothetical protein
MIFIVVGGATPAIGHMSCVALLGSLRPSSHIRLGARPLGDGLVGMAWWQRMHVRSQDHESGAWSGGHSAGICHGIWDFSAGYATLARTLAAGCYTIVACCMACCALRPQ